MPYLRTDDGPRALRIIFLGWKGFTFAWEWTLQRWIITAAITAVTVPALYQVTKLLTTSPVFNAFAAALFGIAAAVWAAGKITAVVSFDQPLAYQVGALAEAVKVAASPRPKPATLRPATPTVGALSPGAARSLRWEHQ